MKTHQDQYPIRLMSRVLDVSHSGYYAWLWRRPSQRQQAQARHNVVVKAAHIQTRETYGHHGYTKNSQSKVTTSALGKYAAPANA